MIKIVFDTNIINALENVDREGPNIPDIKDYAVLLNMIINRQMGNCKIFTSIFVNREILDCPIKDRRYVRRNLINHLLDGCKNPKVMYRKPNYDKLINIFGKKDGAIVFDCIVKNIDYLITRDNNLVKRAKNKLKYRRPKVLTPNEANEMFKKILPGIC